MKDTSRKVVEILKDILVIHPYLRVGQIIANQLSEGESLFYMTDEELYKRLMKFEKRLENRGA